MLGTADELLEDSVQDEEAPAVAKRSSGAQSREKAGAGCCGPFTEAGKLLCRNPQLAKAVLASGLQQASVGVTNTFILSVLMGKIWGKSQAEYNAWIGVAINVLASLTGGAFGRFSDNVDRRLAAAIFGVGQFLPGWAVCVFGLTNWGLWVSTASRILGTIGSASNVIFALANDVTNFQDREIASGVFFAGTNLLVVILNAVPAIFSDRSLLVLGYQVALNAGYFACLAWVRVRREDSAAGEASDTEEGPAESRSRTSMDSVGANKGCCEKTFLNPMRLIFLHRRLRRLCLAAFLLALSSTLPMVISQQYFNEALDLYPYGTDAQFARVALLSTLPGQLMVLPGFLLTGFLAKQSGTLKLLRKLVPLAAVLTLVGALMAWVQALWFVPVIVIAGSYASLWNVPLMRLVSGVAPPGRMGEALSSAGVSMQIAGLLGNGFVAVANPKLLSTNMENALWVYYPLCAVIAVAAILPLMGRPKSGWGAASGLAKQGFYAATGAKVAGDRWLKITRQHKSEREEERQEETSTETGESSSEDTADSRAPGRVDSDESSAS